MSAAKKFQPGRLNHRITFQQAVETADGLGGSATLWQDLFSCWAAIEPISARRSEDGDTVSAETSHLIHIRFRPEITPHMRILFSQRILQIVTLTQVDEAGRYLAITTVERT